MEYRISGHGIYHLQYHIVWVCKYRRRILKPGVTVYIEKTLRGLLRRMPGVSIETIGFDHDHLRMVMGIPPKYAVSDVIAQLKSQSAGYVRRKFPWLEKVYLKETVLWSPGFLASNIGLDEAAIKRYVEYQGRQDEGRQLYLP